MGVACEVLTRKESGERLRDFRAIEAASATKRLA